MGTIKELSCKKCANVWSLYQGVGMRCTNYYCNSCNNQYVIEPPVLKADNLPKCECGGVYKLNPNRFVCPECKSTKVKSEDVGLWD